MKKNKTNIREGGTLTHIITPNLNLDKWGTLDGKTVILELSQEMNHVNFQFNIEDTYEYLNDEIHLDYYVYTIENNQLKEKVFEKKGVCYSKNGLNINDTITNINPDIELVFKYFFRVKNAKSAIYFKEDKNIDENHKLNETDSHIYVYKECMTPQLIIGNDNNEVNVDFKTEFFVADEITNSYNLAKKPSNIPVINVDNNILIHGLDFEMSEETIILFTPSISIGSTVNIMYLTNNENQQLSTFVFNGKNEPIRIKSDYGFDNLYMNNETNGIFLKNFISNALEPIVIKNGVVLSLNKDFYVSVDRHNIVFGKSLNNTDNIMVYYLAHYNTLELDSNLVNGLVKIPNLLGDEEGFFEVIFCLDAEFNEVIYTHNIPYESNKFIFDFKVELPKNDTYYVIVVNNKLINTKDGVEQLKTSSDGLKIIIK